MIRSFRPNNLVPYTLLKILRAPGSRERASLLPNDEAKPAARNPRVWVALLVAVFFAMSSADTAQAAVISLDDIDFWVGSGSNRAAMVVTWSAPEVFNNTIVPAPSETRTMYWGYRFDGAKTGEDMFNAVVAADPRLFAMASGNTQYGTAVFGIGYDLDNDGQYGLSDGFTNYSESDFTAGFVYGGYGDPDYFYTTDVDDLYWGGWYGPNWELWHELGGNGGFTNAPDRGPDPYYTSNGFYGGDHGEWHFSEVGMTGMTLEDGSWMGWSVAAGGLDYGNPSSEGTMAWLDHKAAPNTVAVPEPSGLMLAGCGFSALLLVIRRRATTEAEPRGGEIKRAFVSVLLGALLILCFAAGARADSPYATELIEENATYGNASLYNAPNAVLGEPTRIAVNNDPFVGSSPFHVKIVEPAYNLDPEDNKVITTLSRKVVSGSYQYGAITVKFDHQVYDDPANPYGIDLNVFGNSFYVGSGYVSDTSDMRSYNLVGGIFAEPVVVSVSPDNIDWYTYSIGPYGDTAFPTQGHQWSSEQHDLTGNGWTDQEMDFTKPVNPTLNSVLGAPGQVMSAADAMQTYVNSGGGTGIDLSESGFEWIQYVRVEATAQFREGEIDAFSDVRPMLVGESLSITPDNIAEGTPLFFQSPSDEARTGVLAEFLDVNGLAKLTTGDLDDPLLLSALPSGNLLAGYQLDVGSLIGESDVDYLASFGLLPGLNYAGDGTDLELLNWSGSDWQPIPFQFDSGSGLAQLLDWTEMSSSLAIVQVPEPSTIALLATGILGLVFRRWRRRSIA